MIWPPLGNYNPESERRATPIIYPSQKEKRPSVGISSRKTRQNQNLEHNIFLGALIAVNFIFFEPVSNLVLRFRRIF